MLSFRYRPHPSLLVALGAALLLLAAGALAAMPASATTIDYGSGQITVVGTEGSDDVAFSNGDGNFEDDPTKVKVYGGDGASLLPRAAAVCVATWESEVWNCPRPSRIVVSLLGGDDFLSAYENGNLPFTVPIEAHGDPGNDRLDGGSGNDVFYGGDGDDNLTGRDGDDRVFGEAGNDILNGDFSSSGPGGNDLLDGGSGDDKFEDYVGFGYPAPLMGNDTYIGGPGNDSFSYFNRSSEAVRISLDGIANDGMAGELDNIHPDIESVGGSDKDDVIVGSPGADELWGSDGDDKIYGGGGDDTLWGNDGDDLIEGGPGNDTLDGGCMSDVLIGGPGRDTFNSDGTCDSLKRSPFDRIEARDGERDELIFCQRDYDPAGDTAVVDPVDPVTNTGPGACKEILVGTVSGGGGGGGAGAGGGTAGAPAGKVRAKLGPRLRLIVGSGKKGAAAQQKIVLKKKRLFLGTLYATKRTVVTVRAAVRKGRRVIALGRRKVVIPARRAKLAAFPLSRRALAAVRKSKKAAVNVSFKVGKKTYRKNFHVAVRRK